MGPTRLILPYVLATCGLQAQQVVWEQTGALGLHAVGGAIAQIGDLDSDGWPELVHVAEVPLSSSSVTELWTLSGRDGSVLRTLPWRQPFSYDRLTGAGDVDGDGIDDYAVRLRELFANPMTNIVEVRSGRDDRIIWSVQGAWSEIFGDALLGGLHLNGDDRPDLVLAVPRGSPTGLGGWWGEIHAFDHTGTTLWVASGRNDMSFGWHTSPSTLGLVGDVNGDGADDIVVGGGADSRGGAVILSGVDGSILTIAFGPEPGDNVGDSVDGCGDLNGDGVPDFVAGNDTGLARGVVATYSGADGTILRSWTSQQFGVGFGAQSLVGHLDVDRDGVSDILVGSSGFPRPPGGGSTGAIAILSGREGTVIHLERAVLSGNQLARFMIPLGARPGSPFPLFAFADPQYQATPGRFLFLGRLAVIRGAPLGASVYGTPCAGSLATAPKIGVRGTEEGKIRISVYDAAAGSPAVLLVGASRTALGSTPLPISLESLGFHGCALLTSSEVALATTTGTDGIQAGYAAFDLPAIPAASGVPVYGQWICLGSGDRIPGGVSDALDLRLQ